VEGLLLRIRVFVRVAAVVHFPLDGLGGRLRRAKTMQLSRKPAGLTTWRGSYSGFGCS
jgi:hypothetical protein